MKIILPLAAALASYSSFSIAQTERDLESHVHGAASLNVAIFDDEVSLELNSPWDNLVGFEHAPNTDEQRAMIEDALKQLKNPAQLLSFNGGDCALEDALFDTNMAHDEHDDEHHAEHGEDHHDEHDKEHHAEHGEDHHDEHDKEHHAEHGEDHHDEHGDEGSHSAVLVTYSYHCDAIADLESIELNLFRSGRVLTIWRFNSLAKRGRLWWNWAREIPCWMYRR